MTAILDTSFLFALTDQSDHNHQRVLSYAQNSNEKLVLPTVVLPEICYLISSRLGHPAMCQFVASTTSDMVQIEPLTKDDLIRVEQILKQYADTQLDFTDAAITAIAERLSIIRVCTFDQRDFSIIRPKHCDYFEIFP
jgi:predicted nucleic acid-binding protein